MRTEAEMFALILNVAKTDERIRAVILNGSRANPDIQPDQYQDYDIIYIVRDLAVFTADHNWIDIFGERLMLQMPEAMRDPGAEGHFSWMMLFTDGNRLDLTLVPIEKVYLVGNDSLNMTLLDKDTILSPFPVASAKDYWIKPPSALFFLSCCNNFWWCLQNVAKGLARNELPYAMLMYHQIVRQELHDMIEWYIGVNNDFSVSAGKMGKYFRHYLPGALYQQYLETYSRCNPDEMWSAMFVMCDLFHKLAGYVADSYCFSYRKEEEKGIKVYLNNVKNNKYTEGRAKST